MTEEELCKLIELHAYEPAMVQEIVRSQGIVYDDLLRALETVLLSMGQVPILPDFDPLNDLVIEVL